MARAQPNLLILEEPLLTLANTLRYLIYLGVVLDEKGEHRVAGDKMIIECQTDAAVAHALAQPTEMRELAKRACPFFPAQDPSGQGFELSAYDLKEQTDEQSVTEALLDHECPLPTDISVGVTIIRRPVAGDLGPLQDKLPPSTAPRATSRKGGTANPWGSFAGHGGQPHSMQRRCERH